MILFTFVSDPTVRTRIYSSPSKRMVPAKTVVPLFFSTGNDSPVMLAWFTSPSPRSTFPSAGIWLPARTTTRSSFLSAEGGIVRSSFPSIRCTGSFETKSVCARLLYDCRRVSSSISSPISSNVATKRAVCALPSRTATVSAVASSKSVLKNFPAKMDCAAFIMRGTILL